MQYMSKAHAKESITARVYSCRIIIEAAQNAQIIDNTRNTTIFSFLFIMILTSLSFY